MPRRRDKRQFPALDAIKGDERKVLNKYTDEALAFLDKARTPQQVVSYTEKLINEFYKRRASARRRDEGRVEFHTDMDEGSFALVKYGKHPIEKGVRFIIAHSDSPCLTLRTNPARYEWSEDKRDHHHGLRLAVLENGGIQKHNWEE